jgi:hypothetical protein
VTGEWKPAAGDGNWAPADGEASRDLARQSGVYRNGERLLALNRPESEDETGSVEVGRIPALFGDFRNVTVASDLAGRSGKAEQGEIWRPLVIAALLFLLMESLLLAGLVPVRRPAASAPAPVVRKEAA